MLSACHTFAGQWIQIMAMLYRFIDVRYLVADRMVYLELAIAGEMVLKEG
jgi:hypothetical protein